jgi:hypothetical protein
MAAQTVETAPQIISMKRHIEPGTALGLSVVAAITIIGIYASIESKDITLFIVASLLSVVSFGSNIPHDRGYYVRYDYDTIYQRMHGYELMYFRRHPVTTMRFEDIGGMSTGFVNNTVYNRAFMNFEVILLHHKDGKSDDIFLHPASFTDEAVRDFLHFLRDRRPDIFTPEVTTFLDG